MAPALLMKNWKMAVMGMCIIKVLLRLLGEMRSTNTPRCVSILDRWPKNGKNKGIRRRMSVQDGLIPIQVRRKNGVLSNFRNRI